MTENRGRIIIQDDWDIALKAKDSKIWIGYKVHESKTVYGELKKNSNVIEENGDSTSTTGLSANESNFAAKLLKNRKIKITYKVKEDEDSTTGKHSNNLEIKIKAADQIFDKINTSRKRINCIDVSNGGLGVSSDTEGGVKVWLAEDGEVRRDLKGHYGEVYTCRFFPSGVVVLTGGADMQVKVWSAENGQCAATFKGHTQGVTDTAIIERGRNVISTSRDGKIKLWDCSQSQCIYSFNSLDSGPINSCHLMGAWPELRLDPPVDEISEKEVLTEGKVLLAATESHKLISLGLQNRQQLFSYNCSSPANCCTSISENVIMAGCDDSTIHILDVRKATTPLKKFKESRAAILSLLPFKQGCFVSSGDGSCFYMDQNFSPIEEFTAPDAVYKMATDGRYLYAGCKDGIIRKYGLTYD